MRWSSYTFIFVILMQFCASADGGVQKRPPCAKVITDALAVEQLVEDLVKLRLRADDAYQAPNQPNFAQIAFETAYSELANQLPDLKERFLQSYQAAQSGYLEGRAIENQEQKVREQKSRLIKGYKISKRKDIQWQERPDDQIAIISRTRVEFVLPSGKVVEIEVRADRAKDGHTSPTISATKLSDYRFVTTGGDHRAIVWEVQENGRHRIVHQFGRENNTDPRIGHVGPVYFFEQLSEHQFVTGGGDQTAIIWELDARGKPRIHTRLGAEPDIKALGALEPADPELGHVSVVYGVEKISENRYITVSDDQTAILWEIDSQNHSNLITRVGQVFNSNQKLGHTNGIRESQHKVVDNNLIILTKGWTDEVFIWEPEYYDSSGEL